MQEENKNPQQEVTKFSSNLLKIGIGGGLVLGVSLGLLYYFQNKILYLPVIPGTYRSPKKNPIGYKNPSDQQMDYKNIEIKSGKEGVKLRGWLIKQKQNSETVPTVIFFHENAGNIGHRLNYLWHYYNRVKVNLIIVGYRGFSDSDGVPSEQGIQTDAEAILNYAFKQESINKDLIFTHGRSLGGAVSAHALANTNYPIKGAILENTFLSIADMVVSIIPALKYFIRIPGLLRNKWMTKQQLERVKCPVFFIKSTEDEIVPHNQMVELIEIARKAKLDVSEYTVVGGTHNENWMQDQDQYFIKVKEFINRLAKQQKKVPGL